MNIILTGSNGYIGRNLAHELVSQGHKVQCFDSGDTRTFDEWHEKIKADWFDPADVIIHAGAIADARCQDYMALFDMNVRATEHVALQAYRFGAKLINISSCYAIKYTTNAYGFSKRTAEILAHSICHNAITLRPFNVWGREQNRRNPSIIKKLVEGKLDYVFKDCVRDFIHIDDVVRNICYATTTCFDSGIYSVGTGTATRIEDIADALGNTAPRIESGKDHTPGYEPYAVPHYNDCLVPGRPIDVDTIHDLI